MKTLNNMKAKFLIILMTMQVGISFPLLSQNVNVAEEWVSRYNGPANKEEAAVKVAADATGNVYVAGVIEGIGSNVDFLVMKSSSSGDLLWTATYDGMGNGQDVVVDIAVDNAGNVYITGQIYNGTDLDYATIKYDSSGVQQWVEIYFNPLQPGDDIPKAIAVDDAGNVYVTGGSQQTAEINHVTDYLTVKYSASGVKLWEGRYTSPGAQPDVGLGIAVDDSGYVYVTGALVYSPIQVVSATIKYNASGAEQWVAQSVNPTGFTNVAGRFIRLDDEGNVFVGGYGSNYNDYIWRAFLWRYTPAGVQQVSVVSDGGYGYLHESFVISGMVLDKSGNVYITCRRSESFETVKYNKWLALMWSAPYDGPGNDSPASIALDDNGNVFVTGRTTNPGTSDDYVTISYDSTGSLRWFKRYDGPVSGSDYAQSIAVLVTPEGCNIIYVTGNSRGAGGSSSDCLTIKYSEPCDTTGPIDTTTTAVNPVINTTEMLLQNNPNPFNSHTTISFRIETAGFAELTVYDAYGREITVLSSDEKLTAGEHQVVFDGSMLLSGLYFCSLAVNGKAEQKKMLLIK